VRFRRRRDPVFDGLSEGDAARLRALLGQVRPAPGLEALGPGRPDDDEVDGDEAGGGTSSGRPRSRHWRKRDGDEASP
jgi:hypothetical protein